MNRQLKFRVWTGTQMQYNITVGKFGAFYVNPGSKGDGLDEKDAASLTPFNTKYPESVPVMQYTGLLDKTEKEIYEGDIVKDDNTIFEVYWDEKGGKFDFKIISGATQYPYFGSNCKRMEVIGNIFENPELLTPTLHAK